MHMFARENLKVTCADVVVVVCDGSRLVIASLAHVRGNHQALKAGDLIAETPTTKGRFPLEAKKLQQNNCALVNKR